MFSPRTPPSLRCSWGNGTHFAKTETKQKQEQKDKSLEQTKIKKLLGIDIIKYWSPLHALLKKQHIASFKIQVRDAIEASDCVTRYGVLERLFHSYRRTNSKDP